MSVQPAPRAEHAPPARQSVRPGQPGRLEGLDTLRALSALMVVLLHFFLLVPHELPLYSEGLVWRTVYLGNIFLEAFFAMSGFLIGGELLRELVHERVPRPRGAVLAAYAVRRWTRTLPAYYAVLLALMLWEGWRSGVWPSRWGHVFFFQSYTGAPHFFGVSWTLAVEQWSYVLLPLLMLLAVRGTACRAGHEMRCGADQDVEADMANMAALRRVGMGALCVIAACLALRCLTLWLEPHTLMDEGIRKQTHLRLDALMYGLLLACCKEARPDLYRRLQSGWCLALAVLAALALVELQYHDRFIRNTPDELRRLFHAGPGFTLMGVLAALPLPYLERADAVRGLARRLPRLHAFFQSVSLHSYSLYLIHFSMLTEAARLFMLWRGGHALGDSLLFLALMACAAGLCAALTRLSYLGVERPGMALRKPCLNRLPLR